MVKGTRKPLEEIKDYLSKYNKILILGCGGCASVCLAGGQKEVNILKVELELALKKNDARKKIDGFTIERQCNVQFFEELENMIPDYDCILSMACGAGVQLVAEQFRTKPVFPALNTVSIGIDREIGM